MYTICLDIGNTRMKVGVFHLEEPPLYLSYHQYDLDTFQQLSTKYPNAMFVLSSTAQLDSNIEKYIRSQAFHLVVDHQTSLPFKNLYSTPHTLGIDRIALIAGAIDIYPNQNCLVIDTGTCITMDFINNQGEYLGGSIHPGVQMRLKAMHNFTGKLPLVENEWVEKLIGDNTHDCMKIGAVTGALFEIEHFVEVYQKNYADIKVLLTGGDSELFFYKLKNKIFAHPNLVLEGLQKIALYNAK